MGQGSVLKISKKREVGPGGTVVWNAKCAKTEKIVSTFFYHNRRLRIRPAAGSDLEYVKQVFETEFPTLNKVYEAE